MEGWVWADWVCDPDIDGQCGTQEMFVCVVVKLVDTILPSRHSSDGGDRA